MNSCFWPKISTIPRTKLNIYVQSRSRPRLKSLKIYKSREISNLEEMIAAFLADQPRAPQATCFEIAKPILRGEKRATNLPWKTSEGGLKKQFH